jgi:hypothetical protein
VSDNNRTSDHQRHYGWAALYKKSNRDQPTQPTGRPGPKPRLEKVFKKTLRVTAAEENDLGALQGFLEYATGERFTITEVATFAIQVVLARKNVVGLQLLDEQLDPQDLARALTEGERYDGRDEED